MIKSVFKISGMHCAACILEIDDVLEETNGIKESNTHYAKAETEVKHDETKISKDKIIKLIKKLGYEVTLSS